MIFGKGDTSINDIVMEKYVGGFKPQFKIIESNLKIIVDKINKDQTLFDRLDAGKVLSSLNMNDLNNSKENKIIEKTFKEIFGLKDFMLSWGVSAQPNAMTPIKVFQVLDRSYEKQDNGHKTNSKMTIGVVAHTGMVNYAKLNERELIATILHEIGHNFYQSVFNVLAMIPISLPGLMSPTLFARIGQFLAQAAIIDFIGLGKLRFLVNKKIPEFISKKFPGLVSILNTFEEVMYNVKSIPGFNPMLLVNAFRTGLELVNTPFRSVFLYNIEKHADSYADKYGYAVEGASALEKLRLVEGAGIVKIIYDIPALNWITDFSEVQIHIVSSALSGYPSEQNRIRTKLDRLRRYASDDSIDPRTRKEIAEQLKGFELYYKNYQDISNDVNKKRVFTWAYINIVEKLFKGKADLREIVYALDKHKYE